MKQVMGNWSNERRFAALKNTAILGMLPFAVQSERDKRRMLRCWASTPPSAPPCVLCAAAMQWQSFRFGDGGDGGAATLIMVELCRDVLGLQMGIACPQPFPSVGEVLYLFSYCV